MIWMEYIDINYIKLISNELVEYNGFICSTIFNHMNIEDQRKRILFLNKKGLMRYSRLMSHLSTICSGKYGSFEYYEIVNIVNFISKNRKYSKIIRNEYEFDNYIEENNLEKILTEVSSWVNEKQMHYMEKYNL